MIQTRPTFDGDYYAPRDLEVGITLQLFGVSAMSFAWRPMHCPPYALAVFELSQWADTHQAQLTTYRPNFF